jgi:DNA-binding NtrC family response regulator
MLGQVHLAAGSNSPVLIVGEPGTGKRLLAQTIHRLRTGSDHGLVAFDCAALPSAVIERELFEATHGTPGADPLCSSAEDRADSLSLEEGSSLLIGDILALSSDLQARLARALGGGCRVLATTVGNPVIAVQQERLRPDLYYGLSVLTIATLPLRDRRHDIPLLAQSFLERANQRAGTAFPGFAREALAVLEAHDWPGNLSELCRVVDAAHHQVQLRSEPSAALPLVGPHDLPGAIRGHQGAAYLPPTTAAIKPLDELLADIERRLIEKALVQSRQNKSRAAELLGISRPRLYRRIKELNLPDECEPENEPIPAAVSEAAHA